MFLASRSPGAHVIIGRGGDTDTGMRWREGGSGEGGGRDGSQATIGCEVLGVTRTWEVQKRFSLKPWIEHWFVMTCVQNLQRQIICSLVHGKLLPTSLRSGKQLGSCWRARSQQRSPGWVREYCALECGSIQQITLTDARQRGRCTGLKNS